MRVGKTGASSTQQAFPLKEGHGVRSSRSGKPEYYNTISQYKEGHGVRSSRSGKPEYYNTISQYKEGL
jgi:hypothetical protein